METVRWLELVFGEGLSAEEASSRIRDEEPDGNVSEATDDEELDDSASESETTDDEELNGNASESEATNDEEADDSAAESAEADSEEA